MDMISDEVIYIIMLNDFVLTDEVIDIMMSNDFTLTEDIDKMTPDT